MTKKLYFLLFLLFLGLISCGEEDTPVVIPETSLNTIMPLGASRVAGNRPAYESYRYELWKRLEDGEWEFDFIGTVDDRASYPAYSGMEFDVDHEGRGGWTSGQILAGIEGWLEEAGTPDIVLFSSPGGNDALQGLSFDNALDNVNEIIDIIQSTNPNVTIIIEQMAPGQSFFIPDQIADYFDQIREDIENIAAAQTTSTSKVLTVDMATGFMDSFLADLVHYNEAGARFIAERYYNVLVDVMERK
jgi:lysophospholipase L1-like esterase